jgi:hypothetical protein
VSAVEGVDGGDPEQNQKKRNSPGHESMAATPATPGFFEEGFDLGFECPRRDNVGFGHRTTRISNGIGLL